MVLSTGNDGMDFGQVAVIGNATKAIDVEIFCEGVEKRFLVFQHSVAQIRWAVERCAIEQASGRVLERRIILSCNPCAAALA